MEGLCRLWVADHDIEDPSLSQITIYAGRGLLLESQDGGNILYGTAVEHHQRYQYNIATTKDVVLVSQTYLLVRILILIPTTGSNSDRDRLLPTDTLWALFIRPQLQRPVHHQRRRRLGSQY